MLTGLLVYSVFSQLISTKKNYFCLRQLLRDMKIGKKTTLLAVSSDRESTCGSQHDNRKLVVWSALVWHVLLAGGGD